jgi:hypothetical protein
VHLSYDEAMVVCLLLAEAADASAEDEPLRDMDCRGSVDD